MLMICIKPARHFRFIESGRRLELRSVIPAPSGAMQTGGHALLSCGKLPGTASLVKRGEWRPKMANLLDRISIDPAICGGKPCIRGTRIWVSFVLDLLAGGMPEAELRDEYPQLTHEDVLAAIAYGAEASRERVIPVSVEPAA
jgi:uncharacterized protein (DUF433 family)